MPTVDELFETFDSGIYVKDSSYPYFNLYNEPIYVPVKDKVIGNFDSLAFITGERNVNFVGFILSRYVDSLDLTTGRLYVHYETDIGGGDSTPCNVSYSDEKVRLLWNVPGAAVDKQGIIRMMIYATGKINEEAIIWKTLPATKNIIGGLAVGGGIVPPDNSWYEQFVARMEAQVDSAHSFADEARVSKTTAETAARLSTSTSKEIKDYVESEKASFQGYSKRGTDSKYSNAILGKTTGAQVLTIKDAFEAPVLNLEILGKSEQMSTTGAQLLDLSSVNKSAGGAVVNYGDGGYSISGTGALTASFTASYTLDKNVLKPGNLILKSELTIPKPYVRIWDGNTVLAEMQGNSTKQITQEMIDNDNVRVECFLYGNTGSTITPGTYHPMLYQSGDGTWEPYTGGKPSPSPDYPQKIVGSDVTAVTVTGAQLLPPDNIFPGFLTNANGTRTNDNNYRTIWLNLPAGTYTIAIDGGGMIVKTVIDGVFSNNSTSIADGAGYTCTLIRDGYLGISFRKQDSSDYAVDPKVILNAGNMFKPWQPYQSKTASITLTAPLHGIGDVRDRIMCREGEWGIERNCSVSVFDGSEDERWSEDSTATSGKVRYYHPVNGKVADTTNPTALCSNFKLTQSGGTNLCITGFAINNNLLVYLDSRGLEEFKTWLADNPMTVVYQTATPTWEPFSTDVQLLLNNLVTYQGACHIELNIKADLQVTYVRDSNKVIEELYSLIVSLSGK